MSVAFTGMNWMKTLPGFFTELLLLWLKLCNLRKIPLLISLSVATDDKMNRDGRQTFPSLVSALWLWRFCKSVCQETLYGAMYKFTILLRCLSQNCCCFCIIRTNWSCLSMDTSTSEERTRDSRSHYSKSLNASLHRQWLCIEMMNSLLIRTRLSVTVIQTFGL